MTKDLKQPEHSSQASPGTVPAGKACYPWQAEQERERGPARACTPESARSDKSSEASQAPETLSQKGAIALARRLQAYWHAEGYSAARFWAEPIEERFDKVGTYELYRIASNLINGLPPRYADGDRMR